MTETTLEEIANNLASFDTAEATQKQTEEVIKRKEAQAGYLNNIQTITGDSTGAPAIDLDADEDYKNAKIFRDGAKTYIAKVSQSILDNLGKFAKKAESKLVDILTMPQFKHSKEDSTGKLAEQYKNLREFLIPLSEEQGGSEQRQASVIQAVMKDVPNMIAEKMTKRGEIGDKTAMIFAKLLARITGPTSDYIRKIVAEKYESVKGAFSNALNSNPNYIANVVNSKNAKDFARYALAN